MHWCFLVVLDDLVAQHSDPPRCLRNVLMAHRDVPPPVCVRCTLASLFNPGDEISEGRIDSRRRFNRQRLVITLQLQVNEWLKVVFSRVAHLENGEELCLCHPG